MNERKHEKLIITDINTKKDEIGTRIFTLDENKFKDIPFFTDIGWIWPKNEEIIMEEKSHSHKFDEVITLFGTNPDNPQDLCGEVEFWIDDEKYMITKSCIIYMPKGLKHCPLIFKKVERPIFHYIIGGAGKYTT
jgi:hypothetical protein